MQDPDRPVELLDERDLALIDALQIDPRASWAHLGSVLDLDPVTTARRWQRLTEAGEAWATAALGPRQLHTMSLAFLELDCEAGAALEVAAGLGRQGHVITIQHVAGAYDLWAIAVTDRLPALADYLLGELPTTPGVRKVRSHVSTRVFDASGRWRLKVLDAAASARIRPAPRDPESTRQMDDVDRALFRALSQDGRAGSAELADALGVSSRTVQRRITRMSASGDVAFRCDLARPMAGWVAAAVLWLRVPDALLETLGAGLLRWPETRTCAALAGPSNMLLTVGLHAISDLHQLVARLVEEFPYVEVVDRQLVLRQTKLYGRVLDSDGRWTSSVPVDPWRQGSRMV